MGSGAVRTGKAEGCARCFGQRRVQIDIMKKENRELMEQMLMAIHAKDTLEMLEELIENSDTERIDRKKLLDIIRRSPDMFFEDD